MKEIKNADLQGSYQNGNRVYQTYLWQQEIVNNLSLHRSDAGFLRECVASEIDSMQIMSSYIISPFRDMNEL